MIQAWTSKKNMFKTHHLRTPRKFNIFALEKWWLEDDPFNIGARSLFRGKRAVKLPGGRYSPEHRNPSVWCLPQSGLIKAMLNHLPEVPTCDIPSGDRNKSWKLPKNLGKASQTLGKIQIIVWLAWEFAEISVVIPMVRGLFLGSMGPLSKILDRRC